MGYKQYLCIAYFGLIVLSSLIAIIMYASDKKKAIKGQNRIKEKNLLIVAVLNGAIGSLIGRIIVHHKTDKIYFSITIYFALLCQLLVGGFLVYQGFIA